MTREEVEALAKDAGLDGDDLVAFVDERVPKVVAPVKVEAPATPKPSAETRARVASTVKQAPAPTPVVSRLTIAPGAGERAAALGRQVRTPIAPIPVLPNAPQADRNDLTRRMDAQTPPALAAGMPMPGAKPLASPEVVRRPVRPSGVTPITPADSVGMDQAFAPTVAVAPARSSDGAAARAFLLANTGLSPAVLDAADDATLVRKARTLHAALQAQ